MSNAPPVPAEPTPPSGVYKVSPVEDAVKGAVFSCSNSSGVKSVVKSNPPSPSVTKLGSPIKSPTFNNAVLRGCSAKICSRAGLVVIRLVINEGRPSYSPNFVSGTTKGCSAKISSMSVPVGIGVPVTRGKPSVLPNVRSSRVTGCSAKISSIVLPLGIAPPVEIVLPVFNPVPVLTGCAAKISFRVWLLLME